MMLPLFILLTLLAPIKAINDCQTPTQQPGKCVLINHCPYIFSTYLNQNKTENAKDLVKKSHCGFEAGLFPKVCCPTEGIKYYGEEGAISHNQHATKCGMHEPEGPSDPWLALLEFEKDNGDKDFLCSGVLINKKYILTSAHCLKGNKLGKRSKLINAHFGDNKSSQMVIPIDSITIHEEYQQSDTNQYNDIGLVRLKNKVAFKDVFVRPICVPMTNKKIFTRKTLSTTGFEKLQDADLKKRDGIATVWENDECNQVYNAVTLNSNQICAGGKRGHYRHSLQMNLGGILMHVSGDNSYSLVGILSQEPQERNSPRIYTKVASYIEWIFSNLKP